MALNSQSLGWFDQPVPGSDCGSGSGRGRGGESRSGQPHCTQPFQWESCGPSHLQDAALLFDCFSNQSKARSGAKQRLSHSFSYFSSALYDPGRIPPAAAKCHCLLPVSRLAR